MAKMNPAANPVDVFAGRFFRALFFSFLAWAVCFHWWPALPPMRIVFGEMATGKPGNKKPVQTDLMGLFGFPDEAENAPTGAAAKLDAACLAYIEKYANLAQQEQEKFGIPASISLAQGLVESRAGTSKLARGNNNHFGYKCFSKKCPPGHCTNATDDHHKDFFRKYKSAWESWRDHSKLISSGNYADLKKYGTDYQQWAYGLKAKGYATDRTYAEKLIGMIERYDLHRFD